jgi:hypothetical protein
MKGIHQHVLSCECEERVEVSDEELLKAWNVYNNLVKKYQPMFFSFIHGPAARGWFSATKRGVLVPESGYQKIQWLLSPHVETLLKAYFINHPRNKNAGKSR